MAKSQQVPKPQRLLVSLGDAFYMLGIGRTKGFELIAEGKIKTVIVGKRQMATVKSLECLAEGKSDDAKVA